MSHMHNTSSFSEEARHNMSSSRPKLTSINGRLVPPSAAAVYFADCSNPDPAMFDFDEQIPTGKSVLAFEHAWDTREHIEVGEAETGDYNFLDSFSSLHGFDIENEIKAYARYAKLQCITGTYTDGKGAKKKRVEFLVVDDTEYRALYDYIAEFVAKLEADDNKELLLAQERTKQTRLQLMKDMLDSDASKFWDLVEQQHITGI